MYIRMCDNMMYGNSTETVSVRIFSCTYDRNPGGLLVLLVILNCVNTTEAKMDTACSIEKDGCEVDASVGYKAKGKSMAVTPVGLFVTVDSRRYVYTRNCKCGWLLLSRKMVPALYHLMVWLASDKKIR